MNEDIIYLIQEHGIKPTANRILIASALSELGRPMSMGELEYTLETVDKSVISRTLSIFRENHLVHVLEESDGLRYELCHSHSHDMDDDAHVHFHCETCGKTICLEDVPIPPVGIPEGYERRTANYIIKGLCPECSAKA